MSGVLAGKTQMAEDNGTSGVWKYLAASFFTHRTSSWVGFSRILSFVGLMD